METADTNEEVLAKRAAEVQSAYKAEFAAQITQLEQLLSDAQTQQNSIFQVVQQVENNFVNRLHTETKKLEGFEMKYYYVDSKKTVTGLATPRENGRDVVSSSKVGDISSRQHVYGTASASPPTM